MLILLMTSIYGIVIPTPIYSVSSEWYNVWAVIYTGEDDMSHYSAYMYQILREYGVNDVNIYYLDQRLDITGVDMKADRDNLTEALNWLAET